MPSTESPQRTLTRSQLAERARRADDDSFLLLLRTLRINHGLQFDRGPEAIQLYNLDEFQVAARDHRQCGDECITRENTRGRLEQNRREVKSSRVKKDSSITVRVRDFIARQDKGQYYGLMSDLATALRVPESQAREAVNRNIQKGSLERMDDGGWRVHPRYLPKPKPAGDQPPATKKSRSDGGPQQAIKADGSPTKAAELLAVIRNQPQPCVMTMAEVGIHLGVKSTRAQNLASAMRKNGLIRTERVKGDRSKLIWEVVKDLGQS